MHLTGSELDARPAKREKKKAHFFVSSTGVSPALQPHSTVDSHGHESTLTPGPSSSSASNGGSSSRMHSHGNTLAPLSHYGAPEASNDVVSHSVYDEDVDIAHSLSSYSTLASQSSSSLFHPLTRTTRRSRSSLAALRNALQEYQVPLDSEADAPLSPSPRSPRTPPRPAYAEEPIYTNTTAAGLPYGVEYRDAFGRVRRRDMTMSAQTSGYDLSQRRDFHRYQSVSTLDLRALGSRSALEYGSPGPERMDALVDIHRVLYRGSDRTHASTFAAQGVEVKRVIERWFEQDCGKSFFPQVVDTKLIPFSLRPPTRECRLAIRILGPLCLSPPDIHGLRAQSHSLGTTSAREPSHFDRTTTPDRPRRPWRGHRSGQRGKVAQWEEQVFRGMAGVWRETRHRNGHEGWCENF